jgi:hypothetical protein
MKRLRRAVGRHVLGGLHAERRPRPKLGICGWLKCLSAFFPWSQIRHFNSFAESELEGLISLYLQMARMRGADYTNMRVHKEKG